MAKGKGRPSGSRNRGYFYRAGRGWFTKLDDKFVPLEYPNGDRMRDKAAPVAEVRAAYLRLLSGQIAETTARPASAPAVPTTQSYSGNDATVFQVCEAYLAKVESEGARSTLDTRRRILFDFCLGLPPRFMPKGKVEPPTPGPDDYLHDGFGALPAAKLIPLHLDKWLQAHPTWKGSRRTALQAVKRALNYAAEAGLLQTNPLKGYKTPKQRGRVTYITPEQEAALCSAGNAAIAMAIKVCIRTGARPGCEFAKLTAAHVIDNGVRMEWVFRPDESKTGLLRTIRIIDPEIIGIVRQQMRMHPTGPVFRNRAGTPWVRKLLAERFRLLKDRLIARGVEFDNDCCMYACRHTYAKRVLQGYWSGKATNIENLARLMGNSPDVCRDHYLQWTDSYTEPLWESA
jgi:integrase